MNTQVSFTLFLATQGFQTTGRMGRMGFSPMSLVLGWGGGTRTHILRSRPVGSGGFRDRCYNH